jgi:hypothetical protein
MDFALKVCATVLRLRVCSALSRALKRHNGSDGRLGGRTAVTTLSIWLERTDARVGLLRE